MKLTDREKCILLNYFTRVGGINLERVLVPIQLSVVKSESKYNACLTGRQSGKTFALTALMIDTCMTTGKNCAYIGLSVKSAWDTISPMIEQLCVSYRIKYQEKNQVKEFVFSNGAKIVVRGLDKSPKEMDKFRGQQYKVIVIDESGHFLQDLEEIFESIEGNLKFLDGKLYLIGTPGNLLKLANNGSDGDAARIHKRRRDFFYRITEGLQVGWKVFKWNALDNPFTAEEEKKFRARKIAENPGVVHTPSWEREVLGNWYRDDGALCFKFDRSVNVVKSLPVDQDYLYYAGIDFGWGSPSAICIFGYGMKDKLLYGIDGMKKSKMSTDEIAEVLSKYAARYDLICAYCDNDNRVVEELNKRFEFPIKTVEKKEKYKFINLLNDDFMGERIMILENGFKGGDRNSNQLIEELETCIWDDEKPQEVFRGCSDHMIDAMRYAWRGGFHYVSDERKAEERKKYDPDEIWRKEMDEIFNKRAAKKDTWADLSGDWYLD